jgi:ribosomal-protein-alanine N-acetyltransferase
MKLNLLRRPAMLIETERLILRDYSLSNSMDYFALKTCAEVWKYSTNSPIDNYETAYLQLSQLIDKPEKDDIGFCAIYEKQSNIYVGEAGILSINKVAERGVVGYNLLPTYWNKGFATEITKALVNYAFSQLKLERVEALAMEENKASCKVLEKVGLANEGVLKHFTKVDGRFCNVVYYGVIKENYRVI